MADTQVTTQDTSNLGSSLGVDLNKMPGFFKQEYQAKKEASKAKIEAENLEKKALLTEKQKVLDKDVAESHAKYEEVEKQMLPEPEFKPTQDNAVDIGGLFSMIATMGVALGGSGKLSGLNAMNAMGGMLKGYQQGRKDLFTKEQATFDKELAKMKAHNDALIQKLKNWNELKVKDKEAGFVAGELIAAEYPGLVAAKIHAQDLSGLAELTGKISDMNVKITEARIKTNLLGAGGGEAYALTNNYKIPIEEVARLNKDQMPIVAGKIESARVTSELADLIQQNPGSVGIAGSILAKADKYLPERYGSQPVDTVRSQIDSAIDSDTSIQGTPDQITQARVIAKKALDVVNARALAVSKRLLVSELQMQKQVIGIESMSDASAPTIFKNLAKDDLKGLKRYGISDPTIEKVEGEFGLSGKSQQERPFHWEYNADKTQRRKVYE